MLGWLGEFRAFLACTALCMAGFSVPHDGTRSVAACVFILLCPALFITSAIDVVRRANARREHGEPRSAVAAAAVLPLRGIVALFGVVTALIGAVVCGWVLYLSHAGGMPLVASLFLGWYALKRVFWAREAVSMGGDMVRAALGREERAPEPEAPPWEDPEWADEQ
jgi:hypothetical protein